MPKILHNGQNFNKGNGMLWVKAFHIISMVAWFSGLFYLPRLFVYHAMATDHISIERFKIMERKLYFGIMMPGMFFTVFLGLWLLADHWQSYLRMSWMHGKLGLVVFLLAYHFYLGYLLKQFSIDKNTHGHVFYRILNEVPILFLVAIVCFVVVKP